MTNTIPIVALLSFISIICTAIMYTLWKNNERKKNAPSNWNHIGVAPNGVEIALTIIKEQLPGWIGHYGGTIEWVIGPWTQMDLVKGNILSAGTVLSYYPPKVKVMFDSDVSKTALAHEIFHVYQAIYNHDKILDGNAQLYAWVNETNAKINAAIV